jgi:uncharacterized protein with ParB-like and HNH nuclease domain
MKASETKMEEFLSASKTQFVIPVYQRNYDWTKLECKQLFNDILLLVVLFMSMMMFILQIE